MNAPPQLVKEMVRLLIKVVASSEGYCPSDKWTELKKELNLNLAHRLRGVQLD